MKRVVTLKEPSKLIIILAFASLYLIWGSTYLGIMIAIKSIPPFFMVAARFLGAGIILFTWCLFQGEKLPSFKTFCTIGLGGILMLFLGNGAVTWSEQYVPTGLAAIVVASVPLWFVLLDKKHWKYNFSNKFIIAGIIVGFAGVLMLFTGKGSIDLSGSKMKVISFFVLIVGTIGWAVGSLYSKYKVVEASTSMKVAVQMIVAGIVGVLAAILRNEQKDFVMSNVSWPSIIALLYLVIMGSLVAYMSYIWLLSVRPASLVGTYAYVNPVVAVFLGWLILDEAITTQQVVALVVILAGVILVNFSSDKKKVAEEKKVAMAEAKASVT
jgi:drug/metabolite transporter (DMT)-like permease